MKRHLFFSLLIILTGQFILAQSPEIMAIRKFREENTRSIMQEFVAFLAIPNLAKDTLNINKNTSFIMEMMQRRGIQHVQLLEAVTAGVPPAVYGEVNVPGAKQTF